MREDDKFYYWNKGENHGINKYFDTREFDCHCDFKECIEQKISKKFITNITEVRKEIEEPLHVNSGFRCSAYQNKLRNQGVNTVVAKKSTHELGEAGDVRPHNMDLSEFNKIASKHFKAIGIAKNFTHLDTRDDKERKWNY